VLKCRHSHLDVDDWFGAQPRNSCRAVMVDSQGQGLQRGAKDGRRRLQTVLDREIRISDFGHARQTTKR